MCIRFLESSFYFHKVQHEEYKQSSFYNDNSLEILVLILNVLINSLQKFMYIPSYFFFLRNNSYSCLSGFIGIHLMHFNSLFIQQNNKS